MNIYCKFSETSSNLSIKIIKDDFVSAKGSVVTDKSVNDQIHIDNSGKKEDGSKKCEENQNEINFEDKRPIEENKNDIFASFSPQYHEQITELTPIEQMNEKSSKI